MAKREPKLSQLDYLWSNFGEYSVSSKGEEGSIPTIELVSELLESIKNEAVNLIKIIDNDLIGYSISGAKLFSIDISKLISSGSTITKFGKRFVTQDDIDGGCLFSKGAPIYYIELNNGSLLITDIHLYSGSETSSAVVTVKDNIVYTKVKLNNEGTIVTLNETAKGIKADINLADDSPIKLTKEQLGLKALILLDTNKALKFDLKTETEYKNLETKDPTTVYFIKNESYFYFGEHLIGDGTTKLDDYVTKDELDKRLADLGMEWNFL